MSETGSYPGYTEYHPRWYRPRMSTYWWLQRRTYLLFILRELSSIFVAWFVVFLLLVARAVGQGEQEYQRFLDWAGNPWVVLLNVVALAFVLLHAVTWLNLTPKAMVVRLGRRRVPGSWIAASAYATWAVVSAVVAWLVIGS
jgi:fumarate reductase subunit C